MNLLQTCFLTVCRCSCTIIIYHKAWFRTVLARLFAFGQALHARDASAARRPRGLWLLPVGRSNVGVGIFLYSCPYSLCRSIYSRIQKVGTDIYIYIYMCICIYIYSHICIDMTHVCVCAQVKFTWACIHHFFICLSVHSGSCYT